MQEIKEQLLDDDSIIDAYGRVQGLSPLDVLVAREKMQMVIDIYKEIAKVLSAEDLEILMMWIRDNRVYSDIGGHIRGEVVTNDNKVKLKMVGKRRIVKIKKELGYNVTYHLYIIWKQILLDESSMNEAWTPKEHIGWLCTTLQKINNGGYWGVRDGYKEYKSKSICLIPQYLEESFGTKVICTYCGKRCSRKKDN